ncbi:MAG TPA: GntR family transcriptional regulator, partial [Candidatus Atribacteria bacterium]|nr:GntR family transcriptional regulator [Candidatus Atribacteria bacterium]
MKPINRVKLTESIMEAIVEYASSNNLKVGDRLPSERELSSALRVSRPLLREALRKMESLNLIEVLPGKGTFIKVPLKNNMSYLVLHIDEERDKVLEVLKIRRALEKLAIEEAIKNITDDEIKELEKKVNLLEEKQRRGDDSKEENWAFHSLIYRSAGNKLLFDILDGLKEFHLFWEDPLECPSFAEKTYFFHRELF